MHAVRSQVLRSCLAVAGGVALMACFFDETRISQPPSEVPPPTPLHLESPSFAPMLHNPDNPLTVEGVALGRRLFHDPVLSKDGTVSCASCHVPSHAFSDRGNAVSTGVRKQQGNRNSPPIFNLAWANLLFWDGRALNLEHQALGPVTNPVEMDLSWSEAAERLRAQPEYRLAFRQAFGDAPIDSILAARALAQFQRTLISDDSRYDRWKAGRIGLTSEEELGYSVFSSSRGDCAICHREPHFTTYNFANIGLDSVIDGSGMGQHTGIPADMGKWRIPSLRNLAFTPPYMHDGRFATLEEVIDFYETGGHYTATLDANIHNPDNPLASLPGRKGLGLTQEERQALLAFLAALNDSGFVAREF